MSAHPDTGPGGQPDRLWRSARWVLLAVLLLSFTTALLRVVPASGSTGSLVTDIKAGRTHTVWTDLQGTDVTVRWGGLLTERSYVYRPVDPTQDSVPEFMATVRRKAGSAADQVRFRDFDATYGAGGLGLLLPVAYVLLTPWWWLRLAAVLAGLAVLARMLTASGHRRASGPAWALAGLVTGVGLLGYLWAEPGGTPKGGPPGSAAGAPRWWRAWLATLITAAGLGAVGVLVLVIGGRL
ncbi:hypothetical protein [Streptomyces beihaiensis]|uniref:Uncharacterized protein n=1 Tax=Streptomyces beihaiensis TaxID=2984495 RepID=A0ABT3TMW4_9ACTN|nr:hypothetical protein [Streptomyces beihaiensis]MCX3058346.1 hypothetical protein [Streptomyces beihaiensis]